MSADSTPQKPKLVLAHNNPHLKSHKRRQSSVASLQQPAPDPYASLLPGQAVPGMEHTKQLADALFNKWVGGLQTRWSAMG